MRGQNYDSKYGLGLVEVLSPDRTQFFEKIKIE
jgi:hypothetical protein